MTRTTAPAAPDTAPRPMNTVIPIRPLQPMGRGGPRHTPKGRQVAPADRARVATLCEGLDARADLLIEHLHRLNDAEGALRPSHIAALAERLRLSQVEVFEVASFYHHFEIVDDDAAVPATVVRVCTSLSCAMAGGETLLADLQQALEGDTRVRAQAAPCIGQCHVAPAACVGQRQMPDASPGAIAVSVAMGETGLDYFYSPDSKLSQQAAFVSHIQVANQVNKPLIIHTRDARQDTLALMRSHNADQAGGVLHCFTENWEMARAALDMGFYISISGIMTFRNADELRDVVKQIPLSRLLIETDAPYLAPVPHRGKTNQPAYVTAVAEAVAQVKGIAVAELAQHTTANFYQLFSSVKKVA